VVTGLFFVASCSLANALLLSLTELFKFCSRFDFSHPCFSSEGTPSSQVFHTCFITREKQVFDPTVNAFFSAPSLDYLIGHESELLHQAAGI